MFRAAVPVIALASVTMAISSPETENKTIETRLVRAATPASAPGTAPASWSGECRGCRLVWRSWLRSPTLLRGNEIDRTW
jgi:hypothetical protein